MGRLLNVKPHRKWTAWIITRSSARSRKGSPRATTGLTGPPTGPCRRTRHRLFAPPTVYAHLSSPPPIPHHRRFERETDAESGGLTARLSGPPALIAKRGNRMVKTKRAKPCARRTPRQRSHVGFGGGKARV